MGKPIPYTVRRSVGKRQFHGFVSRCDTGRPQYAYPYSANSLLKKRL